MAHFYDETEEKKKIQSKVEKIELFCIALVYMTSFSLFLFFQIMPELYGVPAFAYWITAIFSNGLLALLPTIIIGILITAIGDAFEEGKIRDQKRQSTEQWHAFLHEESRTLNEIAVLKQHHLSTLSLREIQERIQSRNELLLQGIDFQQISYNHTCPCCSKTFSLNALVMDTACDCPTVQEMKYAK